MALLAGENQLRYQMGYGMRSKNKTAEQAKKSKQEITSHFDFRQEQRRGRSSTRLKMKTIKEKEDTSKTLDKQHT